MKKIFLTVIIAGLLTGCMAYADDVSSNSVSGGAGQIKGMTAPPTAEQSATMKETADDIAKVFKDFGVDISAKGVVEFLFILFFGARVARKAVPDRMQTGIVGKILAHAALEVNPEPGTPPPPKT